MKPSTGKALDISGAILFGLGLFACMFFDARVLGLAFAFGVLAFAQSFLAWDRWETNDDRLLFESHRGPELWIIFGLALGSAVFFLVAFYDWASA